jgi:hypothetical protein
MDENLEQTDVELEPIPLPVKKAVDALGSIDDYGIIDGEPIGYETHIVKNDEARFEWKEPKIVWGDPEKVVCGDEVKPKRSPPKYVVAESRWGEKITWPLKPYCTPCSPAAPKENDREKIYGFDEMGAEKRMSAKESRLIGTTPDKHFSFTLIEKGGEIVCSVCGFKTTQDIQEDIVSVVKVEEPVYEPSVYDPKKLMLGIEVGEQFFRFPNDLVSKWVEQDDFQEQPIHILKRKIIFTTKGKEFLRDAVYDEKNNQWLLSPHKCNQSSALNAQVKGNNMWVDLPTILQWRKTAMPMETLIVCVKDNVHWTITQQDLLRKGFNVDGGWGVSLKICSGPICGVFDSSERNGFEPVQKTLFSGEPSE